MSSENLRMFPAVAPKSIRTFSSRFRFAVLCVLAISAYGLTDGAHAQDVDSSEFKSEQEALAYLEQNPLGPLADAAFMASVEFQLAREHPEFAHSGSEENAPQSVETQALEGMY